MEDEDGRAVLAMTAAFLRKAAAVVAWHGYAAAEGEGAAGGSEPPPPPRTGAQGVRRITKG